MEAWKEEALWLAKHSILEEFGKDDLTAYHLKTVSPPYHKDVDNYPKAKDAAEEKLSSRILPGDFVRVTKDGARLASMRGGFANIGASDFAQILFFAADNLIREYAQNKQSFNDSGRLEILNDDGEVTARLTMTDNDLDTYEAANDVKNYPDHFPLQVDIGKKGDFITMFVGEVIDKIRQNRLVLNLKKNGEVTCQIGDKLHEGKPLYDFKLDNTGMIFRIIKEDGTEIYKYQLNIHNDRVDIHTFNEGNVYEKVHKGSKFTDVDHRYSIRADVFLSIKTLIHKVYSRMIDWVGTHKNTQTTHEAGLDENYFKDKEQS